MSAMRTKLPFNFCCNLQLSKQELILKYQFLKWTFTLFKFLLLSIFLTLANIANGSERDFNKLFLQASLSEVHLDDKYGDGHDYFIKWDKKPPIVSVFFTPDFKDDYENSIKKKIEKITTNITSITNINFTFGETNINHDKSNFYVVIGTSEQLLATVLDFGKRYKRFFKGAFHQTLLEQKDAGLPVCGVQLVHDRADGNIHFAMITLEVGAELEKCIYEEFFQSMGLLYDANFDDNSIVGTNDEVVYPTDIDWKMLRTLYDNRIRIGKTYQRTEILQLIKTINEN